MEVVRVLVVAEKPSIAEILARHLSMDGQKPNQRKGKSRSCSTWECKGIFGGQRVEYRVTSTAGHIYSTTFSTKYRNWEVTKPAELFDATTVSEEACPETNIPAHLSYEAKGCSYLVLCLDNDREGENIAFEVISICAHLLVKSNKKQIYRARFSALTKEDIHHAMQTLTDPNKLESDAVTARQIIDLKLGCAFTRYQTTFFQGKYGDLDSKFISYGPCQTPTLFFCVDRQSDIFQFQPETYYSIAAFVDIGNVKVPLTWARSRVFDRGVATLFHSMIAHTKTCTVKSVARIRVNDAAPKALNTVTLLRNASKRLGIGPHKALQLAERLYLSGYISYPRTETDCYPKTYRWRDTLSMLQSSPNYVVIINDILGDDATMLGPKSGTDAGDHPPITPVRAAHQNTLSGDEWRIYDLVVRHFLASVAGDCKKEKTQINVKIGMEEFSFSKTRILKCGYNRAYSGSTVTVDSTFSENIRNGDILSVTDIKILENKTRPPPLLTESDLLDLMERHKIGTDASMATHVNNILERNYVKLVDDRRLEPTKLGRCLVDGYLLIDPDLVLPSVRATIEQYCDMIAKGKASLDRVVGHTLQIFRLKFDYYVENIENMNALFDTHFTSVVESGSLMSRCGVCNRYMTFINKVPFRLFCRNCSKEYHLPNGGTIKLYKEIRCPLDNFELVQYQALNRSKSYSICPMCYNDPPFEDIGRKKMSCIECPHPTCSSALAAVELCKCSSIPCQGSVCLDVINGAPNWLFFCTSCTFKLRLSDSCKKVEVTKLQCETCDANFVAVVLKSGTSLDGCLFCTKELSSIILDGGTTIIRPSRNIRGRGRHGPSRRRAK